MKFDKFKPCHIIVRAVEGKPVFVDELDCSRYLFQVWATNIGKPSYNIFRKNIIYIADQLLLGADIPWKVVINKTSPLVDILSFALAGDRAHFIVSPNVENGIAKYVHKINLSFAKYYNARYNREGILFNKPYKSIPLETVEDLDDAMRYVNVVKVLDVYSKEWRKGVDDWTDAYRFVERYRYSSYADIFSDRSSKMLASESILAKYLGGRIDNNKVKNIDFIEWYLKGDYDKKIFLE